MNVIIFSIRKKKNLIYIRSENPFQHVWLVNRPRDIEEPRGGPLSAANDREEVGKKWRENQGASLESIGEN